ncbi:TPA: hypothetical protein OCE75_004180 [Escherichia coli]|nr:hypothetical protein [Escherichia coli]EEZ6601729.1 hypothetical protein [Escherichia coli]EFB9458598.1 hypothetical protein [Escherichia coli]EJA4762423.1 hypothetical protein [Escherichia coli]EJM8138433.1 hypothetical protein [Escherichia coli]OKT13777.1 hypothetical protein ACN55_04975 [Escherichia coli]
MLETKKPIPRTYLHVDPEIFKVLFAEAKRRQIMVSDLMLGIITEAAENIKQKKVNDPHSL